MAAAGNQAEALARIAEGLCEHLGYPEPESEPDGARSPLAGATAADLLSAEDEALVQALRRGLARLAASASEQRNGDGGERGVSAALDGAELVMRGELVIGNASQLPALVPSFVFLVTLPVVEQDRALELSQRAEKVIEGALGG